MEARISQFSIPSSQFRAALAAVSLLGLLGAAAPRAGITARYDLRVGDHLVYRETLERQVTSGERVTRTRIEFENHVIVTAGFVDGACIGVQRNRTGAELIAWKEGGRDRTAAERDRFGEQTARRPAATAEGNCVALDGTPRLPVSVNREWNSLALVAFHEVDPLPEQPIDVGDTWQTPNALGFRFRAAACTPAVTGCVTIEGTSPVGRSRATYSASENAVTQFQFTGDYVTSPNNRLHETLTFEFAGRQRRQAVASWLDDPATRRAALAGFSAGGAVPVPAEKLYSLLDAPDDRDGALLVRQALGLAYRLRVRPPSAAVLQRLSQRADPRVRALVERMREDNAQGPAAADRTVRAREVPGATLRAASDPAILGRGYVMHVPDDYRGDRPFPLIVYLGGGSGLALQAAQLIQDAVGETGYLVLYPNADGYWWDGDRPRMVRTLLDETVRAFNVDANRIYLAGFSNGGIGALQIGGMWPETFAAIAPSMAAVPPDGSRLLAALRGVPLLLLHGDKDAVIPVENMHEVARQIRRGAPGAPLETHVFPGRGHDIYIGSDDGLTLAFFERHVRR